MKSLLLALACSAASFASLHAVDEPVAPPSPPIVVPVRLHLVHSTSDQEMNTTLLESDVRRIFAKVQRIWAQAGIQLDLESIVETDAKPLVPDDPMLPEQVRIKAAIPKEQLSPGAIDVCYVKSIRPNGFYYGEPVIVKDTASLREVPGGIDEPIPRVTAHEIGHAFGLGHRQEITNLMASGNTGFSLNAAEIQSARESAGRKFPQPAPAAD
jgi:hypothetical protein